ncbi:hypothetical protein, partial [Leuconostoc mesenteroides]|uniref:hypothetical protein n=1 Tax=Leuconostoc mesenteroides TaxID=1245 RepID=UPI002362E1D4
LDKKHSELLTYEQKDVLILSEQKNSGVVFLIDSKIFNAIVVKVERFFNLKCFCVLVYDKVN